VMCCAGCVRLSGDLHRSSLRPALTPHPHFCISIRKYNLHLAQLTIAQMGTQQWLISSLCLSSRERALRRELLPFVPDRVPMKELLHSRCESTRFTPSDASDRIEFCLVAGCVTSAPRAGASSPSLSVTSNGRKLLPIYFCGS
jgi:hypothetical protein